MRASIVKGTLAALATVALSGMAGAASAQSAVAVPVATTATTTVASTAFLKTTCTKVTVCVFTIRGIVCATYEKCVKDETPDAPPAA